MPVNEDFYDFYSDEGTDLIVLDEFKASKPIQVLNQWLDGQQLTVRVKGGQRMKLKNHPFIILSNYTLEECYTGAFTRLDTLRARLCEIEIEDALDLDKVFFDAPGSAQKEDDDILSPIL